MADVSISLLQLLNDDNDDFRQHDDVEDINSLPYWSRDFDDTFDVFSSADLSDFQHTHLLPQVSTVGRRQSDQLLDGDALETECIDFFNRDNQVNFVMDLLHQRVEQSQSPLQVIMDPYLLDPDTGFGVIDENEEIGSGQLELDLERELGLRGEENPGNGENSTFVMENCDDEIQFMSGLRVNGIESDSDSDENAILGLDFNTEDADDDIGGSFMYENDSDDPSLRLCWESFQLEDRREVNEDFEWEEIDGRVDEREILNMFLDEAPAQEERVVMGNLDWDLLLGDHSPDPNLLMDQDEDNFTADYEMMFAPFADTENALISRPPASKSVVKNLPSLILSKDDSEKNDHVCAVCKDEMSTGETVRLLPCAHKYHEQCILPWLGIRNTCPVCRYELPTDDPEYERRRTQR